jgi:DNA invertase Pin-like site-specific DNA recombinase
MEYIAYYRVSTQRQARSGLGLDAQRETVTGFAASGCIRAEFIETESGKRADNRPQLKAALASCKKNKAVLLIAKLDRLARNVAFISSLMESGVEFIACDMPQANRLTIHILAAVAEHEAELISARTKAALQAAKARGTILGNPRLAEARARAAIRAASHKPSPESLAMMRGWRDQGASYREIARRLNACKAQPPCSATWHSTTVRNQLRAAA